MTGLVRVGGVRLGRGYFAIMAMSEGGRGEVFSCAAAAVLFFWEVVDGEDLDRLIDCVFIATFFLGNCCCIRLLEKTCP